MTKAEERALVAYPPRFAKCVIFPETVGADFNTLKRKSYQEGYEQAEKDLALTWEDMRKIREIICGIDAELESLPYGLGYQEYWEEILTRFKQLKEDEK